MCDEKIPPFDSHGRMQVVCGINMLMATQSDFGYGSLSKKLGKEICVRKQGRESQWLQQDGIKKLVKGWEECIEVEGDYMEKW